MSSSYWTASECLLSNDTYKHIHKAITFFFTSSILFSVCIFQLCIKKVYMMKAQLKIYP